MTQQSSTKTFIDFNITTFDDINKVIESEPLMYKCFNILLRTPYKTFNISKISDKAILVNCDNSTAFVPNESNRNIKTLWIPKSVMKIFPQWSGITYDNLGEYQSSVIYTTIDEWFVKKNNNIFK